MYIIGIDPGYDRCGFAVLRFSQENQSPIIELTGVLTTQKTQTFQNRLYEIGTDIEKLFQRFPPTCVVLEDLFWGKNHKTALLVSQIRGVITYQALQHGAIVKEPKPVEVKNMFTGNGKATKQEMKKMVELVFQINAQDILDDTIDAIAMAAIANVA